MLSLTGSSSEQQRMQDEEAKRKIAQQDALQKLSVIPSRPSVPGK